MFKEMNYVYAVYRERSFTKAAQKLYISQPALSAMVKKAEAKIGTPIFDRSTSPITITEAGKYYIEQVEKIMTIQDEAAAYFKRLGADDEYCLRLGGSYFFLRYTFPPAFRKFREINSNVKVSYTELRNDELIDALFSNKIDFFFEVNDISIPQVKRICWAEERLILAVPASFEINRKLFDYALTAEDIHERKHLIDDTPAIDLSVFAGEPFILLRPGHDTYERAVAMCSNAGFIPCTSMTTDQIISSYNLAAEGYGVAFIRDSILYNSDLSENLLFYKVDDPLVSRKVYLYYLRQALRPIVRDFLGFIRDLNGLEQEKA